MKKIFPAVNFDGIPQQLTDMPSWCVWRAELSESGKPTKVARYLSLQGARLSVNKPDHWAPFTKAAEAYIRHCPASDEPITLSEPNQCAGVGLLMRRGLVGVDLDKCANPATGEVTPWALNIIRTCATYAEYSPSRSGVRLFMLGGIQGDFTNAEPVGATAGEAIEVYEGHAGRWLTISGQRIEGTPAKVSEATPEALALLETFRKVKTKEAPAVGLDLAPFEGLDGEALLASVADRMPPHVASELREGIETADRSGRLQHLTKELRKAGLAQAECMAVLTYHMGSMGVALTHRNDDAARAAEYLQEHHVKPAWADKNAAPVVVEFEPVVTPPEPPPKDGGLTDLEQMALGKSATQDSAALALRKLHAGRYVYAHQFGHWMVYDGTRWLADPQLTIMEEVRRVCRRANKAADLKELTKASFFRGVVDIAKHDPAFSVLGTEFDANTDWLNTPAGVVDLTTGKMRPHDPLDRLSKITAVTPSADGGKLFIETLFDICDGDFELMEFLQVSLGAMLSGAHEGHWLQFWYGTGRNGKNLLADLVFHVLGDYAHKMPSSALMTRSQEQHPTSLAALAGRRFVLSSEVPDGAFWNTSTIKELTGDETITARFMRQDEFTFRRTHKHLILGNHRPQFRETDPAMVSRMKLVPFAVSFAGRENPDLPRLLRANAGFVLSWLVEGHLMWRANGKQLPPCEAVEAASRDYFAAQSTTAMWLSECCARVADDGRAGRGWHKSSTLYASYSEWKKARGETPVSQTRWGDEMEKLGLRRVKADGFRYVGVCLSHLPDFAKEVIDNE